MATRYGPNQTASLPRTPQTPQKWLCPCSMNALCETSTAWRQENHLIAWKVWSTCKPATNHSEDIDERLAQDDLTVAPLPSRNARNPSPHDSRHRQPGHRNGHPARYQ